MALSYQEILEQREKRKSQELQFALRRPKLPTSSTPSGVPKNSSVLRQPKKSPSLSAHEADAATAFSKR